MRSHINVWFGRGSWLCLSFPGQPGGVLAAGVTVGLFGADPLYRVLDLGDLLADLHVRVIMFRGYARVQPPGLVRGSGAGTVFGLWRAFGR